MIFQTQYSRLKKIDPATICILPRRGTINPPSKKASGNKRFFGDQRRLDKANSWRMIQRENEGGSIRKNFWDNGIVRIERVTGQRPHWQNSLRQKG
jgi:hypothetical protein